MDNSNTHILPNQKSPTHTHLFKKFLSSIFNHAVPISVETDSYIWFCCQWTAEITEFLCHPVTVWDRLQFWRLYWLNEFLMLHFSNYCSQWTGSTRPFRKKQKIQILYFIIELSRKVSGFPLYFFPCQFENAFQLDSLTRTCNIFFLQFLGW